MSLTDILVAADLAVETSAAELRFTLRVHADVSPIALQDCEDLETRGKGIHEERRLHEGEVVRRCVVFGIGPVRRSREPADGQVDPGGSELAFILAPGREV